MVKRKVRNVKSFQYMRENDLFYIDKTKFITEWWLKNDYTTVITRPDHFGKTFMLDTI